MKIVDVCAFYAPKGGGVRTYVDRKLIAGAAAGHEIVIIAPGEQNRTEHRGPNARIEWLASPRFPLDFNYRYFADAPALYAALDRERPDMVEASSPWRSASMIADWPGQAPRALVMHADPLSAYAYRWFEGFAERTTIDRHFDRYWRHLRRLDAGFDSVVSASPGLSARLRQGGLNNVVTNPMGVDPGIFSPRHRDVALRRRLLERCGLDENATLLLGVGRYAPEKRWPMIIDAVATAGYRHRVGLVLVGNGRERARIVRMAADNPHVQLLTPIGDRPTLARLMASADGLVHGCEAETFCMVAAEAAASGLPLIVPDQGGAADHGRSSGGWLYAAGAATQAAGAIGRFLAERSSTNATAAIGSASARTMDDHFAELFAHYEALLEPARLAA